MPTFFCDKVKEKMGARGGRPASESSQPKKVSAGLSFDKLENCKQDDLLSSLHSDMVHSVLGLLSRAEQARVSLTRDCPDDQIKPVCKYWLILVAQMNSAFNDLDVALYLKANAHLKNVQFPNYAQLTDVATSYIAEALTDVKHVNLNNCRKITDNGLKEILKKVSPTPSLLPSQHGESLITLQCNCVYISNSGIKMIAEMAPNLQSLGLSWIYANDFTPLTKLVSLTELDLSKNSGKYENLFIPRPSTNRTSLALGTFPQICEFPKLKTLNFQDIKSYYKPFTNVKNTLKIVDISNKHDRNYAFSLLKSLADTNPDVRMFHLFANLHKLEELYADGNPTASEQQWIEVFSKLPKLKVCKSPIMLITKTPKADLFSAFPFNGSDFC